MRIAFLADIHANRGALEACLEHARRQQAERYVFLGDYVGYGADPGWVLDTVMEHVARGAVAVLGNHDQSVLGDVLPPSHPDARDSLLWTRDQINGAHREFLASLPLAHEEGELLAVHANAWAPERWEYILGERDAERSLRAAAQRYSFCGHMHDPALYWMGQSTRATRFTPGSRTPIPLAATRRWLVVPGSVGQPRDGNPAAAYGLFESRERRFAYFRVPYDVDNAALRIHSVGLPGRLAERLAEAR